MAVVGIIMGSTSDYEVMQDACKVLDEFGVSYEKQVVSAHRTPDLMYEYAHTARDRGIKVIIAGAGGAAHLPGIFAAVNICPVIGVPIISKTLSGIDSLYSIVQMPSRNTCCNSCYKRCKKCSNTCYANNWCFKGRY